MAQTPSPGRVLGRCRVLTDAPLICASVAGDALNTVLPHTSKHLPKLVLKSEKYRKITLHIHSDRTGVCKVREEGRHWGDKHIPELVT